MRQFRAYLIGRPFVVRTDHAALQWLQGFKEPEGQVAIWLEQLQEFAKHQSRKLSKKASPMKLMENKEWGGRLRRTTRPPDYYAANIDLYPQARGPCPSRGEPCTEISQRQYAEACILIDNT